MTGVQTCALPICEQLGTGIGLYVARQVVMQHGGRIEVASVKGEGSTFTVTMPRILAK